jgi:SAM-dependent methyltransferase
MEMRGSVRRAAHRAFGRFVSELDSRLTRRIDVLAQLVAFQTELESIMPAKEGLNPHDLFSDAGDDFWLWLNTNGYRQNLGLKEVLPSLPPEDFQHYTGDQALRSGFEIYRLFRTLIEKHYKPVSECNAILDFGCGWGRVLRFFLKDVRPEALWGVDMWDEQVEWAEKTDPWPAFVCIDRKPPTELPSRHFDVVFAFSVFSHMAEDLHLAWLDEFARILVPGGIAILTTWGVEHIDFLQQVNDGTAKSWDDIYNKAVTARFSSREDWISTYAAGKFCHLGIDYEHNPDYGETLIPIEYVEQKWPSSHTLLEYVDNRAACMQNVIVTWVNAP